jgi:dTMP kinase
MSGLFITLEGVEGCGKSTQLARLEAHLTERGRNVVTTREPGGTEAGAAVRDILLNPDRARLDPLTEHLLYEADRAQHLAERVRPALEAGAVVLCDRFADSTTAYQGAGRGLDMDTVQSLHRIATDGTWPNLTFLIDLDPREGLARTASRRRDRMEREALAFHERVRQGFLDIAAAEPGRVRVVDGARDADAVAADIRALADGLLEER